MFKGQKGITLISLVVTIVILIILAAVAISMTIGDNGLFNKAKQGKTNYQYAANDEQVMTQVLVNEVDREASKVKTK